MRTLALRAACFFAACVMFALAVEAWTNATPTNCTFPTKLDAWRTFVPGDVVPSEWFNRLECVVSRLATRSAATPRGEVVCTRMSVAAGRRITFTVSSPQPLVGNEMVTASVLDDTVPNRVDATGWSAADPSGFYRVLVWNHDPDNTRIVRLCTSLVRP